ncbi:hypothetical protein CBS9595_003220 [Malassezia furfur]|nr:hypothetical protein CBS9595_003220 [Malassezia furfur]
MVGRGDPAGARVADGDGRAPVRDESANASTAVDAEAHSDAVRALLAAHEVPFVMHDDADVHENELEEFYSYVEAPLFVENRESWIEWCATHWDAIVPAEYRQDAWPALPARVRRQVLQRLLAALDLQDPAARLCASRALLYHLQGTFDDVTSDDEQMHWVRENAQQLLDLGGVDDIFVAAKRACWKHEWFSALPDYLPPDARDAQRDALLTPETKAEYMEEINVEVTVHFAQLYTLLEMLRGDDALGEALMALDPPLPVFLFRLVANLREKSIKGFPVKKLVLLLWKSLLATLGGARAIEVAKARTRQKEGLGARTKDAIRSPTTPDDIRQFSAELAAKYPTLLHAGALQRLHGAEELAMATQPLPARHASDEHATSPPSAGNGNGNGGGSGTSAPLPMRQGKLKFQTDQSRPFVLPYAPELAMHDAVPASIQEALQLYGSHLHIDTGVWQTCAVREQLISEMQGDTTDANGMEAAVSALQRALAALPLGAPADAPAPPTDAAWADERLAWVDQVYGAILPDLQSAVIVLLKLMLATTTSGGTSSAYARAVAEGVPSEKAPEPTLEDMDIVRHREILNKAISALLLLTLRWFKASHVLKFEYVAQVMLDSNILLLILKIFGLQEVSQFVRWRSEVEAFGMLAYCRRMRRGAPPTTPQALLAASHLCVGDVWDAFPNDPPRLTHAVRGPDGTSAAYSWRNFATTMHLTRILHKVCKHKVHRILLLVQYKSAAILKRSLRVQHTPLQQYVLKLIKSQVPFCGRKWRQSNMRIITLIYLLCKPGLRDDWLGGSDIDAQVDASLAEEQTLRALIQFYNQTRYASRTAVAGASDDAAAPELPRAGSGHGEALHAAPEPPHNAHDAASVAFERDAFPLRQRPAAGSTPGRYISDDAVEGYLDVYEDVLHEMFAADATSADASAAPEAPAVSDTPADAVSTDAPDTGARSLDENRNVWEHLSPREMRVLASASPRAPSASPQGERSARHVSWSAHADPGGLGRRVNSSPAQLHPMLHWNMEDLVEDALSTEQSESDPPRAHGAATEAAPGSPLAIPAAPLPSPQPGGIDEVEHIFGA